jgi:predicted cupin superfamily sugar epimerase
MLGMTAAAQYIRDLRLVAHPEGGFYRVTYESPGFIPRECLPSLYNGSRRHATAIYFLIEDPDFSAFHKIASDELWHFYTGGDLTVHVIDPSGVYTETRLGASGPFQAVVPGGSWFAATSASYSLVGCTVSPGFDFADFQIARRAAMIAEYPQHLPLIERLTRE